MFLQVLAFPYMEEMRDPADSHYTSISKSVSGPSRSQCPSAIWPFMCQSVCVVVMCVQVIKYISGNLIYNGMNGSIYVNIMS